MSRSVQLSSVLLAVAFSPVLLQTSGDCSTTPPPPCCDDGNDCTADVCDVGVDPETGQGIDVCTYNLAAAGSRCAQNPDSTAVVGVCSDLGACEDCVNDLCQPAGGQSVSLACRDSSHHRLWPFTLHLAILPTPHPIQADTLFTADIYSTVGIPQSFLAERAEVRWTIQHLLETVRLQNLQSDLAVSGATGGSPLAVSPWSTGHQVDVPIVPGTEGTGPTQVASDLLVPLRVVTGTYTAGSAGSFVTFSPKGVAPDFFTADDVNVDTYFEIRAPNTVGFSCQSGTVNDNGTPANRDDDFIDPPTSADVVSFMVE